MTQRSILSTFRRPGMVLAMLALLAQLWMVQSSARHWADMATQALLSADVCTLHGQGDGPQGNDQPMGGMQHCPVCSAASASFIASHTGTAAVPPGPQGATPGTHDSAPPREPTRLRPPAQGPPLA
ncbi:MAG: hypothetical protein JSR53_10845 [Proteobacteria bacterium]|nr:hypothetical protein [Pseudomonadota bacterium]